MKTEIAKEMLRIVQTRLNNRGVLKPIEYKTLLWDFERLCYCGKV